METAIGVFDSSDRAEEALKELFKANVPQESVVFLTPSENEAVTFAKELGAYAGGFVGGAAGLSAAAATATLFMIPGFGQAFALGVGASALLGFVGARTGSALGKAISKDPSIPESMPDNEDAALFRKVLKDRRSLILVRTEWHEIASVACNILDRLGIGMPQSTAAKMRTTSRQLDGVTVLDVSGRIALGEGNVMLRETIRDLLEKGKKHVLLNLAEVNYIDSAGIGELVRTHTTLRKHGGQLKLVNPSEQVHHLLEVTSLTSVFDIQKDETSAIKSFVGASSATA
jgi:anti-sigma B factor antagonist